MQPKTKLQKKVVGMSQALPPLTDAQKAYPYKLFDNIGYYWKGGDVWCQCCGNTDEVLKSVLAVSLGVGSHTCPNCGTNLKLEHWRQTNRQHSNECKQYSVVQTFKGWMVVRTFDVHRNNTRGKATDFSMSEIYQNWVSEDGKEIILGKKYTRSPFHFTWYYNSAMDVKQHNANSSGYYALEDVFDVSGNYLYPIAKVTPILKRNGWTNKILKFTTTSVVNAMKQLLTNPIAETVVKSGQLSVFKYMLLKSNYTIAYHHAINICNRNNYIIKDASMWFDYLDLLSYFNLDTHNAHYVCPKDLSAEHDKLMRRKARQEAQRELATRHKEAARWEKLYQKEKGKFFGLCFSDKEIVVTVLQKVSEFVEEGTTMHHCVFTNEYFKKKDSLILSARIGDKRIETIEVSLKTFKVVQSRGVLNKNTRYHDRIIGLVAKNIQLIRQKMTA